MSNQGGPSLAFTDFSGGLTENPYNPDPTKYVRADNLLVTQDRHLRTRPGAKVLGGSLYQLPTGLQRVGAFYNGFDDTVLFAASGQQLFYKGATSWTELQGPSSRVAFATGDPDSRASFTNWRGIVYATNDTRTHVMKMYHNESGTLVLRQAGMPTIPKLLWPNEQALLAAAIAVATNLRTALITHYTNNFAQTFTSVVEHLVADGLDGAELTAAAVPTTLPTLITCVKALTKTFANHSQDVYGEGKYHGLATATEELLEAGTYFTQLETTMSVLADPETIQDCIDQLNLLTQKAFAHTAMARGVHTFPQVIIGATNGTIIQYSDGPKFRNAVDAMCILANQLAITFRNHINSYSTSGAVDAYHYAYDTVNLALVNLAINSPAIDWFSLCNVVTDLRLAANRSISGTSLGHFLDPAHWHGNSPAVEGSNVLDPPLISEVTIGLDIVTVDYAGALEPGNLLKIMGMLNDFNGKLYTHIIEAIMHAIGAASVPTHGEIVPHGGDLTVATYLYAFVASYEYYVGSTLFKDYGVPLFVSTGEVLATSSQPLQITRIPSPEYSPTHNYDTANVKVEVFRTTNAGTTYYKVAELAAGVTSMADSTLDTDLQTRETLYSNGGIVLNDQPPPCKYVHIVNNVPYFGNIQDGTDILPNRVRQGIVDDPDASPGDFYDDLLHPVVGISSYRTNPVVFCEKSFARMEGIIDELGQGVLGHQNLSDTVGCVNGASIVQTEFGIFFAGTDGFYHTDAFNSTNLTALSISETYQTLVKTAAQKDAISGNYNPTTQQVWWSILTPQGQKVAYILHLKFGVKPDACFTTASNDGHFNPSAFVFFQGYLYHGDERGYVFQHRDEYSNDSYVNTAATGDNWRQAHIPHHFISCYTDFGSSKVRKWVTRIQVVGRNASNLTLAILSTNDEKDLVEIKAVINRDNLVWGDPDIIWDVSDVTWGVNGLIDQWRRFKSGQLRCNFKQIEFKNATDQVVAKSDSTDYGNGTFFFVVAPGTSFTFTTSGARELPANWDDCLLYLPNDGYVYGYEITDITGFVITCLVGTGTKPANGAMAWEMRGTRRSERLDLMRYTMYFTPLGSTENDFAGTVAEGTSGNG